MFASPSVFLRVTVGVEGGESGRWDLSFLGLSDTEGSQCFSLLLFVKWGLTVF